MFHWLLIVYRLSKIAGNNTTIPNNASYSFVIWTFNEIFGINKSSFLNVYKFLFDI